MRFQYRLTDFLICCWHGLVDFELFWNVNLIFSTDCLLFSIVFLLNIGRVLNIERSDPINRAGFIDIATVGFGVVVVFSSN